VTTGALRKELFCGPLPSLAVTGGSSRGAAGAPPAVVAGAAVAAAAVALACRRARSASVARCFPCGSASGLAMKVWYFSIALSVSPRAS
jgi:hypothetical protein